MTCAFKLSTVGSGVSVGVLVGAKVSVGAGIDVDVDVKARVGVKLSAAGRLVEVEAGCGEVGAEVGPLLAVPHDEAIRIKMIRGE